MLNIVRRGPASAAPSWLFRSLSSRCIRTLQLRDVHQRTVQLAYPTLARSFNTSVRWNRPAAAATVQEDAAIEAEIEQEVNAEEPPSDAQIDRATNYGPVTKFKELAERRMVSDTVVEALTEHMRLETMTHVQSLTIKETLKGDDVIAQAKTGTGKTLAFLLPVIQNIINVDPNLERRRSLGRRARSTDIRAIIISPTRELAEQISVEAKKVTKNTDIIVQLAVGGTKKDWALRKMKMEGCHILVGTPGRLQDLLSDPYSQVRAPKLSALVLDEADRLLDQGFAPEIKNIQSLLPSRTEVDRQTLLFSATVPREVMQIVRQTMKPNFRFVRTVQEGEQQTHEKVPQKLVNVGGFENLMPALVELCKREINNKAAAQPFKAIVFFAATAEVALASSMLQNLRNSGESIFHQHPLHPCRIIEIHSKLTQQARTSASESFRRATSAILLSSDVTARGLDFPNVTHIIQVGLPPSQEQYVHRIGRTARGDKAGEGWLLVSNLESQEVRRKLPDMPLEVDTTLETAKVDMKRDAQLPEYVAKILTQVGNAAQMVPRELKANAYMANLGIFAWANKRSLISALNDRAQYGWAMEEVPSISRALAQKLQLTGVPGINIGMGEGSSYRGGDRREGFGGGGRSFYGDRDRGGYSRDRDGGSRGSRERGGSFGGNFSRGRDGGFGEGRGEDFSRGRGGGFGGSYSKGPRKAFGARDGGEGRRRADAF